MKILKVVSLQILIGISMALATILLVFSFFMSYQGKVFSVDNPRVQFEIPKDRIKKVLFDNGMTVLIFKNTHVPKVLVQIAYDVGSAVESDGERGLAHLIEHMIFKGTNNLSEGDIDAIARKYGADFNAFTSHDITSYYFEVNKNNWKPFVSILADSMQNARFEDQHLASELKAVIQELRMRKDNYFLRMVEKSLELTYPSNHPYHHPVIGYKQDLFEFSADRLQKFYKKYYHPSKAVLFVIGDVDIDEVIEVASSNFGVVPKVETNEPEIIFEKSSELVSNVTNLYEDVKNELLGFYWEIPGLKSGNEVLASVVSGVLAHGDGSCLYRRLVDEEKIAVSVDSGVYPLKESGVFFILIEPKNGCREKCRNVVIQELSKIVKDGNVEDRLKRVVRTKEREFFSSMESAGVLAYEWIKSFFATRDEYEIFRRVDKFYDINSKVIQDFVSQYLNTCFINEMALLPLPEDKKGLWLKNKEFAERMDLEILKKHIRTEPLEEPKFVNTMPEPNKLNFSFPKPSKTVTLKNGLDLILYKSDHAPLISSNCRFKDASFFSLSKVGLTIELMMNMLIEGSVGFSKKENVDFFEAHGVRYVFDSMGGRFDSLNVAYKAILERFFHVLTNPKFSKDSLEKLKAIFVDMYQRSKDSPQAVAIRSFKSMIYRNHPYGWIFDEAIELINKLKLSDLEEFHKKYISPENMILSISGNFDVDEIQSLIEDVFGKWQGTNYQEQKYKVGDFKAREQQDYKMLRDQVVLLLGQPSEINIYHEDFVPLKLINFICFDSLGSRLFELRERTGLFYVAAGGWGEGATKVNGFDYVYALLSLDKLDQAEEQLRKLIDQIGESDIDKKELDTARQWYLKGVIDLISSNKAIAGTLGYLKEFELGFDYYDKVLDQVQSLTTEELSEVCKKYFKSDKLARVKVGRV